jgi:chromosome segregation protein
VQAKSGAEEELRAAIRAEAAARERLAAATNRSGRLFALEEELERTRAALGEVEGTLERRQEELEGAEQEFLRAERDRAEAEGARRRIEEVASVRRAEAEALARALAGHQAELARLDAELRELRAGMATAEAGASELESEIERLDAVETPLAEEQAVVERERSELFMAVSDLEAEEKGLLARQEVVEARRAELAESPGARFAARDAGRAVGVLRDLIDAPVDLKPAVVAALGQFADAVVYANEAEELAAASAGTGRGLTLVRNAGPGPPAPIPGERALLDAVRPDPRVGAVASWLLGEVYLVGSLAEAAAKHRRHPEARFVTPEGAMVAPSFVRTSSGLDERLEGVRRESAAIDRELSSVHRRLREARHRLAQLTTREDQVRGALEETDALITAAAEEMARIRAETTSLRREEHFVLARRASVEEAAGSARLRLDETPASPAPTAPVPPVPEPPIRLRIEVEALRRERSRLEAGVARARREVEALASEDPVSLRAVVQAAERERISAEERLRDAEEGLVAAGEALRVATEGAREATDHHARANASWRQEVAALDALRQEHEGEDRARHDLERRIREGQRLLREGHGADPEAAVAGLTAQDTVEELQRRGELVARRLGLVGRVNLLATGELEAVQERHDFLSREMDDVRAARRDLQQVIVDVDARVADLFDRAFRDVAQEFAALFQTMFPGGEGRLTLTDPGDLLGSGVEVEARPGRGRVKRLSLLSGGERSLAALAFLFAIFRARPSPFYLMDEVEAALDDVNLLRFLEVVRAFASDSQVLIVTHQKRTMETADVLYGVSMGRDGASTVISQRLLEVAAR